MVVNQADLFVITDLLRLPQHAGTKPRQVLEFANVPPLHVPTAGAGRTSSFVVGYIGSLNANRNLAELVEVVGELQADGVSLVIGGFGNLEAGLRHLAARYANVEFLSWVPYERVLELESAFDVMAVVYDKQDAAHRWGSPNKLFEAMALGKPLIVGDGTISASRALAVGNGVAVAYGSKTELRDAILFLKNHPEQAAQMGQRGRELFLREYNLEVMAARLLDAYRNL
jgi:glycosyltransferase involved in cell wall biosynthesis